MGNVSMNIMNNMNVDVSSSNKEAIKMTETEGDENLPLSVEISTVNANLFFCIFHRSLDKRCNVRVSARRNIIFRSSLG